jgi:ABC-type oligopeptide transport system ATPase subunit
MLNIENLRVEYDLGEQVLVALRDVSLKINKGEILGLVGESGCGKSTLGKSLVKLTQPKNGKVYYDQKEILGLSEKDFLPWRKEIQMVFQDPWSSLNPRISIGDQIKEVYSIHDDEGDEKNKERVQSLLEEVGLNRDQYYKYPHEFSGGQLQRIGIARALAVDPEFIICDEVVSALDVSIQAQILNLLLELRQKRKISFLFISHDLGVIRNICDRVAVLYMGKLVELAATEVLFTTPKNPYTAKLLNSVAGFDKQVSFNQEGIENYSPQMWDQKEGDWVVGDSQEYLVW